MQRVLSDSLQERQRRPVSSTKPHVVCARSWPGMAFRVEEQNISELTTWRITRKEHTVVVHLAGAIRRLETELPGANGVYPHTMPGEVWVVPGNTAYASLAHGELVRFAELHVDAEKFPEVTGANPPELAVRAKAGHYDAFLHQAVERLRLLSERPDDLSRLTAQSLSQAVYLHVFHAYGLDPTTKSLPRYQPRFSPSEQRVIQEHVQTNLGAFIRVESMLPLVGMKLHPFLSAFRATFGTTPAQYVIDQRLRRARHLLVNTKKDIIAIAYETGFSSHAHLSSAFRARMGTTPREFRHSQTR